MDFFKINRPCTCIVTPSFVGELLVIWREVIVSVCTTPIIINEMLLMGCSLRFVSSQTLNVNVNQSVDVRAEYVSPFTSGTFYHCIGFQQNGTCMIDSILTDLKIALLDSLSILLFSIIIWMINILNFLKSHILNYILIVTFSGFEESVVLPEQL